MSEALIDVDHPQLGAPALAAVALAGLCPPAGFRSSTAALFRLRASRGAAYVIVFVALIGSIVGSVLLLWWMAQGRIPVVLSRHAHN